MEKKHRLCPLAFRTRAVSKKTASAPPLRKKYLLTRRTFIGALGQPFLEALSDVRYYGPPGPGHPVFNFPSKRGRVRQGRRRYVVREVEIMDASAWTASPEFLLQRSGNDPVVFVKAGTPNLRKDEDRTSPTGDNPPADLLKKGEVLSLPLLFFFGRPGTRKLACPQGDGHDRPWQGRHPDLPAARVDMVQQEGKIRTGNNLVEALLQGQEPPEVVCRGVLPTTYFCD